MNNKIKNKINVYYLLNTIFEFFRTNFHAIYSLYLFQKGLSLGEISIIKVFFIVSNIIFEVPTGAIADKFGRKRSFQISAGICSLSFLLYAVSENMIGFIIAEILYGIALAFESGSLEADVVDEINKNAKAKKMVDIGKIFSKSFLFMTFAMLISGFIGSFLYKVNINLPWVISSFGMLLLFLIMFYIIEKSNNILIDSNIKNSHIRKNIKNAVIYIFGKKIIMVYIIFIFVFEFASQPIYQYWSLYFSSKIGTEFVGFIFIGMHLASMIGNSLIGKIKGKIKDYELIIAPIILCLPIITISICKSNQQVSIILFFISQIGRGMMFPLISKYSNNMIEASERSTILSTIYFISNIGGILSLILSSIIIKDRIEFVWGNFNIVALVVCTVTGMVMIKLKNK